MAKKDKRTKKKLKAAKAKNKKLMKRLKKLKKLLKASLKKNASSKKNKIKSIKTERENKKTTQEEKPRNLQPKKKIVERLTSEPPLEIIDTNATLKVPVVSIEIEKNEKPHKKEITPKVQGISQIEIALDATEKLRE